MCTVTVTRRLPNFVSTATFTCTARELVELVATYEAWGFATYRVRPVEDKQE